MARRKLCGTLLIILQLPNAAATLGFPISGQWSSTSTADSALADR
jgi:hypothetical protein